MDKSARIISLLPVNQECSPRLSASGDSAEIPGVRIPVRCPRCQTEQLCDFPEPVVVMALTRWNNMNLYVPCHEGYWSASRSELLAIRQYLGDAWIKSRAHSIVMQHPRQHMFV